MNKKIYAQGLSSGIPYWVTVEAITLCNFLCCSNRLREPIKNAYQDSNRLGNNHSIGSRQQLHKKFRSVLRL